VFEYIDTKGDKRHINLNKAQLAFTFCSVPVVYSNSGSETITVHYADGNDEEIAGNVLSREISNLVFKRGGKIDRLEISVETKL
jgi:hypothetical protein